MMIGAVLQSPLWIELPAVVAGALAGALFAQERGLDVIGVLALGLVSGLGGGLLRDVLLSRVPLALQDSWYLWAVAIAALVGAFFAQAVNRLRFGMLLVGTITGVGGSVLRNLLVGEAPPRMLRRGPPYASAAFLGAAVYVGLVAGLDVRKVVAQILTVLLILFVRGIARWRGWQSPEPRDLTPAVLREKGEESPANRANSTPTSSVDSGDRADASGGIDQGKRA
jgi:uncharacterized membrane protein YeiH